MATNRKYGQSDTIWPHVKVIAQTASRTSNHALSSDPVVCGQVPGVALDDADENGRTRMQVDGIFEIQVTGKDASGTSGADANVAVNGGDALYFDKDKTPPVSKRAGGILFGYAVGDSGVAMVTSGATGAIMVQIGKP